MKGAVCEGERRGRKERISIELPPQPLLESSSPIGGKWDGWPTDLTGQECSIPTHLLFCSAVDTFHWMTLEALVLVLLDPGLGPRFFLSKPFSHSTPSPPHCLCEPETSARPSTALGREKRGMGEVAGREGQRKASEAKRGENRKGGEALKGETGFADLPKSGS